MEWIATLVTGLAFLILMLPLRALLGTVLILVPLAHLGPPPPMLARAAFKCPSSRRQARATFVSLPGADRPSNVVACSVFGDGQLRCEKGCLAFAHTSWERSPMTPRYALLADGIATRR